MKKNKCDFEPAWDLVDLLDKGMRELKADSDFIAWLGVYDPGWKTEYWPRNLIAMYHCYKFGRLAAVIPKGMPSREPIPPEFTGFFRLGEVRKKINSGECNDYGELLILLFLHHQGPVTKSRLLDQAKAFYWPGYASYEYMRATKQIDESFKVLTQQGELIFEKGKPLKLRGDLLP